MKSTMNQLFSFAGRRWYLTMTFNLLALACAALVMHSTNHVAKAQGIAPGSPVAQSQDRPSVAVLFLVDESGGVNGECDVSEDLVFVTDREERRRYQIIRFFIALLGSAYDERYREADRQAPLDVQVGVAQFADRYQLVYPFQSADRLFDDPFHAEARRYSLDPCSTNYIGALEDAAQELAQLDVDHRVLVLITDGSFRGTETIRDATERQHNDVRNATGDTLEYITQEQEDDIRMFAFILGYKSRCYDENDCGLRNDEYNIRRGDMARWGDWDNDSEVAETNYLTLLDVNGSEVDAIEDILSIELTPDKAVRDLTPRGKIVAGDSQSMHSPSCVYQQHINVVSFGSVSDSDSLVLCRVPQNRDLLPVCDAHFSRPRADAVPLGDYWWRYEREFEAPQFPHSCTEHTWSLQFQDGGAVYVWSHLWNRTFDDPGLLSLEVPEQVTFSDEPVLRATAVMSLGLMPDILNNSCYEVVFNMHTSDGNPVRKSPSFPIDASTMTYDFDLSMLTCPSRMITVGASIQGTGAGDIQLPVTRTVELYFRPEIEEYRVAKYSYAIPPREGIRTHVITIPIRCAACNEGFAPEFFLMASSDVVDRAGCPANADLRPRVLGESNRYEMSTQIRGGTIEYVLTLRAGPNGTTYACCGYDTIEIEIDGDRDRWQYDDRSDCASSPPVLRIILFVAAIAVLSSVAALYLRRKRS